MKHKQSKFKFMRAEGWQEELTFASLRGLQLVAVALLTGSVGYLIYRSIGTVAHLFGGTLIH